MNFDDELLARAQEALGTGNATETVHAALKEVIRLFHMRRLLDREAPDVPYSEIKARRRPEMAGLMEAAAADTTEAERDAS
ncbi:MAG: type II toxin-antitoxin system VapB family antitoxin [Thermoleophilia bacterium]|nr:type II toxin-antitoxin system VapB family antitoxin [Thermoleophilia bacterium]